MRPPSISKSLILSCAAIAALAVSHSAIGENNSAIAQAQHSPQSATRSSAIGQRAAAAIEQRDAESDVRNHLPLMAMQRRSVTATANNRHNLSVIDNVIGKALEILCLAFGVALVVSAVIEKREKKEEIAKIGLGTSFVLFGLFCPPVIHSICDFTARTLFP